MFENDHRKSHENENRPKHLFAIGVEKSPKTAWWEKIQMAAIFHLILNLNLRHLRIFLQRKILIKFFGVHSQCPCSFGGDIFGYPKMPKNTILGTPKISLLVDFFLILTIFGISGRNWFQNWLWIWILTIFKDFGCFGLFLVYPNQKKGNSEKMFYATVKTLKQS